MKLNFFISILYFICAYIAHHFLKVEELQSLIFIPSIGVATYFFIEYKERALVGIFLGHLSQSLVINYSLYDNSIMLILVEIMTSVMVICVIYMSSRILLKQIYQMSAKEIYEEYFSLTALKYFVLISILMSGIDLLSSLFLNFQSSTFSIASITRNFFAYYSGLFFAFPFILYLYNFFSNKKSRLFFCCTSLVTFMMLSLYFHLNNSENERIKSQNQLRSLSIFESYQEQFTILEAFIEAYNGYYKGSSYVDALEFLSFSHSIFGSQQDVYSVDWISRVIDEATLKKAQKEIKIFGNSISSDRSLPQDIFLYTFPKKSNSHYSSYSLSKFPLTQKLVESAFLVDYPVFGEVDHIKEAGLYGYAVAVKKQGEIKGVVTLIFDLKSSFTTNFLYGLKQEILINGKRHEKLGLFDEKFFVDKFTYNFFHGDTKWSFNFYHTLDTYKKNREIPLLITYIVFFIFFAVVLYLIIFTSGSHEKIEKEVKVQTKQLHDLNDELLRISDHKTRFLANMSHEIRTPLNGIIATSEILKEELSDVHSKEKLEIIHSSGALLLMIINDILDLTKIESDRIQIEKSRFHLPHLIKNVILTCKHLAASKEIDIVFLKSNELPDYVIGDSTRLTQVLLNILNNAIKFSHRSSEIVFEINQLNNGFMFKITDSGIGMDISEKDRIFEPFTQADVSTTRKYGGTGLGLNISKKLVGLMNGEIDFISELNKGTTFSIFIPLEEDDQPISQKRNVDESAISPSEFSILVVEDNGINLKVFDMIAKKMGLKYDHCENGLKAVNMHSANSYDIIFMDVQMPVMDGIEATQEIRKYDQNVIIVGLSANAFSSDSESGLKVGMNYYLSKPITLDKIRGFFADLL